MSSPSPRGPGNLGKAFKFVHAYAPMAVLDMNGDSSPEVVVTESGGETWNDVILERDGIAGTWKESAVSIGGCTM